MFNAKNKKHKVSKKTKKSWRKHIDIKDVDAFLENNRLEERLGVPISERTDTQLFIIDKSNVTENITSKRTAKLALKTKEPRCFASLKPHTCVPDPISKRNKVKTKEKHKNFKLWNNKMKEEINNALTLKEVVKSDRFEKNTLINGPEKNEKDIWNDKDLLLPETVVEWMSSDGIRHTMNHLGVKKRKVPSSLYKKSSILSAVEMPHPGMSYNPSYNDHQELLHEVAQKELKLIKQEEHLNRVTIQMFNKISLKEKDECMMKEMSEGLSKTKRLNFECVEKDCNEEECSFEYTSNNKQVKNIKKTLSQRKKQQEQKQAANKRVLNKLEKKKISDIYKLKILQKQIETKEKKKELLRQKRMKKRVKELSMPKKLSKIKFEPIDLDFQLAEELSGNLRNCKPSQNLLKERYKSLQQRNIIAPTIIKLKRDKAKMKKFVKSDHKIRFDNVKKVTLL